ncbi:MAG: low molecular weight phosphotyrosine protein phosphatase [Phycisphaerales bacterium]|nr:MAG: low molecular weight phosphotyrosine protein phosphatase [Phycisphaerales bacterium]
MSQSDRISVLFICMGNICRSPLAEGVFRQKANERGVIDRLSLDSAGTGGWHVGEPADPRMQQTAERHGIKLTSAARQVHRDDFERFDYLICMDRANLKNVKAIGAPEEKLSLLLDYLPDPPTREVPDPYYGGPDGFERVFELVDAACDALLDRLVAERSSA